MVLGVVGSSPTSHPTEIAAIDNESVSCRNSCFRSTQAASRAGGTGVSREHRGKWLDEYIIDTGTAAGIYDLGALREFKSLIDN